MNDVMKYIYLQGEGDQDVPVAPLCALNVQACVGKLGEAGRGLVKVMLF